MRTAVLEWQLSAHVCTLAGCAPTRIGYVPTLTGYVPTLSGYWAYACIAVHHIAHCAADVAWSVVHVHAAMLAWSAWLQSRLPVVFVYMFACSHNCLLAL